MGFPKPCFCRRFLERPPYAIDSDFASVLPRVSFEVLDGNGERDRSFSGSVEVLFVESSANASGSSVEGATFSALGEGDAAEDSGEFEPSWRDVPSPVKAACRSGVCVANPLPLRKPVGRHTLYAWAVQTPEGTGARLSQDVFVSASFDQRKETRDSRGDSCPGCGGYALLL